MKYRYLVSAIAALAVTSAFGGELGRYQTVPSGPLIALKDVGAGDRPIKVTAVVKIGAFGALDGQHLVFGVGDLTRFFDGGLAPIGDGLIVGEYYGCNSPGQISALLESWRPTSSTNHSDTCFSGLSANLEYRLTLWVTANQSVRYQVAYGERVLVDRTRVADPAPWHNRGVFVFGVSSGAPYELKSLVISTE